LNDDDDDEDEKLDNSVTPVVGAFDDDEVPADATRYEAKRTEHTRSPSSTRFGCESPLPAVLSDDCNKAAGRVETTTGASTEHVTTVDPNVIVDHPVLLQLRLVVPVLVLLEAVLEFVVGEPVEDDDEDDVSRVMRRIS
jgi:hypothetical protein